MDPHIEHATRSWCPLPAAAWYEHDYPHLHGPDEDTGGVPGHPHPADVGHHHLHARGVDPADDHDHHLVAADLQPPDAATEQRPTTADRPDDIEHVA